MIRDTDDATQAAEAGATAVEYAIMASAIAAVVVGIVLLLGQQTLALFDSIIRPWS